MDGSKSSSQLDLWVLILAGGIGSRFWPVSTPARPKQLLPLGSDRPLIVDTVERARRIVPDDRIRVLSGGSVADAIQRATGLPESAMMREPEARGTCPVLAWAAHRIGAHHPGAVLASLHADHVIAPEQAFVDLVADASRIAFETRTLLTVAAPPTRAETGYGYIRPGEPLATEGSATAYRVEQFEEKPDRDTAERYVTAGYLWNTGIFVWRADTFLDEVRAHAPEVASAFSSLERGDDAEFFARSPVCTVDEAILERSARVGTVTATFRWDDVGSWEAVTRTRDADEHGNVRLGDTHLLDAADCVAFADDGPVVMFGVKDLVVVRSGGVSFVTTRERAPDLKRLVATLPERLRDLSGSPE